MSTSTVFPPTANFQVDSSQYESGSILVRFGSEQPYVLQSMDEGLQKAVANTEGAHGIRAIRDGWHRIDLPTGLAMEDALEVYRADPNILYAEPNYTLRITQLPNDPAFTDMWGLENSGQSGGTTDADIDANWAWDVTTGSGNTVVAVIDTGVDYNHPDLASNMWVNAGEIPGDGIDNDGNNYVDDVFGYDFINHDGDPMDDQGHGTHVAGTIGAAGNNGLGVTGINWNVQVMALKFLGADGSGTTQDAIEAIYYARDNGADVINASWGGDPYSQALYDAIAATRDADQIFVAAAGNGNLFGIGINNDDTPFYPSGYELENILSVAATDHNDQLATFSNYGATTVDLAAPGVNILSTVIGTGYDYNSGTSMAAPHVAGVAALVSDLNPSWTSDQVIQQILSSVDPLPNLQGLVSTGGRLNVASAVGNPEPPPPPPPPASLPMFEEFSDSQFSFIPQSGNWSFSSNRYTTTPAVEDPDFVAISTLNLDAPLPANVEIRTLMQADPGKISLFGLVFSNHQTNGLMIYDYVDANNYKFAGADIEGGRWIMGHTAGGNWSVDAQVADDLQPDTLYDVRMLIQNGTDVTLLADGIERLSLQHATPVTSGDVGLGAKDSTTHFDDVVVREFFSPSPATLPFADDFGAGTTTSFEPTLGAWFIEQGRFAAYPGLGRDSVSTVTLAEALPSDVEIQATINADDVSNGRLSNALIVFDYQDPENFKFAGAFAGADLWVIGHRTASSWVEDATLSESIAALADYDIDVRLEGSTATLTVNGVAKVTHTFGDALNDGELGVGTQNAYARFDDFQVGAYLPPPPPPATTLPVDEDFNDGVADYFESRSGTWMVESGRYHASPTLGQDGVSTLRIADALPANIEIQATINANSASSGRLSNALVIFDYQDPLNFKYAGAFVGVGRWLVGHRTAGGWVEDATLDEPISALTDYDLEVVLEGSTASLTVNGVAKVSHTFGDALNDGDLGVGTQNALARFDNVQVEEYLPPPPPPSTSLPVDENFNDGVADYFEPQLGTWSVQSGGYRVVPISGKDGISTLRVADALPTNLEIQATINADDVSAGRLSNGLVIFDYQDPNNFKFAGAFVGGNRWVIGHRTASSWVEDATLSESIAAWTDYDLDVVLEGNTATLTVDGATKASYTFGDALNDGDLGVGTQNALARFDNVQVTEYLPPPPPPATTLPAVEDFDDGVADYFEPQLGTWTVELARYRVSPNSGQDGISTLRVADALPTNLEIQATINADDVSSGRLSNGLVIFDYQDPLNFKFAGAFVGGNRWVIGHRTASSWVEDATLSESIAAWTDYDLDVVLEGNTATLTVDGATKASYTFGDALNDGDLGVGTQNALARFDNVQVEEYLPPPPPPSTTLPAYEDFNDAVADYFDIRSGAWTVESSRYRVVPILDQDGVSTVRLSEALPSSVEIQATMNADDVTPNRFSNGFVIYDYQSPTNFKFAGGYVASNLWLIGHRDSTGWITDVAYSEPISPWTDYDLQVILEGTQVRLLVDGAEKLVRQYSDDLTDGDVGVGTRDALAYFDDVYVGAYMPQALAIAGVTSLDSESRHETQSSSVPTAAGELTPAAIDAAAQLAMLLPAGRSLAPKLRTSIETSEQSQEQHRAALDECFTDFEDDSSLLAPYQFRKAVPRSL
nr:S8 family peptidase [Aeoliella straminimaris]